MTKRIQLSRAKGSRMPPNTKKVDRSTKWGNPFTDGPQALRVVQFTAMLRGEFVAGTSVTVAEQQAYYTMAHRDRDEIKGWNLGCWCRLGTPCHCDVLLAFAST